MIHRCVACRRAVNGGAVNRCMACRGAVYSGCGGMPRCVITGAVNPVHGRNCWVAVVYAGVLAAVAARGLLVANLCAGGLYVALAHGTLFLGPWRGGNAPAAVKAGAHVVVHYHGAVNIRVVHNGNINIAYGCVVLKVPAVPTAAPVAMAGVAKAVVYAAVKADAGAPVS